MTSTNEHRRHAPILVIIRGNCGSGKSTVAQHVRDAYGRGVALIEQDYLRRVVLREHGSDSISTIAPEFITTMTRTALNAGYHVVLEGILHTGQYGALLRAVIAEHPGPSAVFWMNVSFDETLRRHAGRPHLAHISRQTMVSWYVPDDLLNVPGEQILPEQSTIKQSVTAVLHNSGLAEAAALTRCPELVSTLRSGTRPDQDRHPVREQNNVVIDSNHINATRWFVVSPVCVCSPRTRGYLGHVSHAASRDVCSPRTQGWSQAVSILGPYWCGCDRARVRNKYELAFRMSAWPKGKRQLCPTRLRSPRTPVRRAIRNDPVSEVLRSSVAMILPSVAHAGTSEQARPDWSVPRSMNVGLVKSRPGLRDVRRVRVLTDHRRFLGSTGWRTPFLCLGVRPVVR